MQRSILKALASSRLFSARSTPRSVVVLGEEIPVASSKSSEVVAKGSSIDPWLAERHSQHWEQVRSSQLHSTHSTVCELQSAPQVLAHFTAFEDDYALPVCLAALRVVLSFQLREGLLGQGSGALAPLLSRTAHTLPSFISHMAHEEVVQLMIYFALHQWPLRGPSRDALAACLQRHAASIHSAAAGQPHMPGLETDACMDLRVLHQIVPWLQKGVVGFQPPCPKELRTMLPLAALASLALPCPALAAQLAADAIHSVPAGKSIAAWQLALLVRACVATGASAPSQLAAVLPSGHSDDNSAVPAGGALPTAAMCTLCSDLHALGVGAPGLLRAALARVSQPAAAAAVPLGTLQALLQTAQAMQVQVPDAARSVVLAKQQASSRGARACKAALQRVSAACRHLGAAHKLHWPLHRATGGGAAQDAELTIPLALPQHKVAFHPHYSTPALAPSSAQQAAAAPPQADTAAEADLRMAEALEAAGWKAISVDARWASAATADELQEWLRGELLGRQRVN